MIQLIISTKVEGIMTMRPHLTHCRLFCICLDTDSADNVASQLCTPFWRIACSMIFIINANCIPLVVKTCTYKFNFYFKVN